MLKQLKNKSNSKEKIDLSTKETGTPCTMPLHLHVEYVYKFMKTVCILLNYCAVYCLSGWKRITSFRSFPKDTIHFVQDFYTATHKRSTQVSVCFKRKNNWTEISIQHYREKVGKRELFFFWDARCMHDGEREQLIIRFTVPFGW